MAKAHDIQYWRDRIPGALGHEIEADLNAGRLKPAPQPDEQEEE